MGVPFSKFYCKIWFGFCLNSGKHFCLEVSFQSQQQQKTYVLLKNGTRDFQNSLSFERSAGEKGQTMFG